MLQTTIPAVAVLAWCQICCSQQPAGRCCPAEPQSAANVESDTSGAVVMEVELLALDLRTCNRCTGTDSAIEAAVTELRPVLASVGVELRFRKTVVQTYEQAAALRFQSSPTIRIDGRDLPIELRESRCNECTTLCGGDAGTDCRVWVWGGREYTEAPKGLIVDAILRAYPNAGNARDSVRGEFVLPENLQRFFHAKRERPAAPEAKASTSSARCCDTTTCCAAIDKSACCGTAKPARNKTCGCDPH